MQSALCVLSWYNPFLNPEYLHITLGKQRLVVWSLRPPGEFMAKARFKVGKFWFTAQSLSFCIIPAHYIDSFIDAVSLEEVLMYFAERKRLDSSEFTHLSFSLFLFNLKRMEKYIYILQEIIHDFLLCSFLQKMWSLVYFRTEYLFSHTLSYCWR